jgi:hypothetical protein
VCGGYLETRTQVSITLLRPRLERPHGVDDSTFVDPLHEIETDGTWPELNAVFVYPLSAFESFQSFDDDRSPIHDRCVGSDVEVDTEMLVRGHLSQVELRVLASRGYTPVLITATVVLRA